MSEMDFQRELLEEIRELRRDFQDFRGKVIAEQGEQRGRNAIIAAVVSFVMSLLLLVPRLMFAKK